MARRGLGDRPLPSGLPVRTAAAGDAASVARVHVETWRSTYAGLIPDAVLVGMSERNRAAHWAQALTRWQSREKVLVAVDEADQVVGFGSCGPAREVDQPGTGEVYTLYVTPDHQGAGLGRALLFALFDALTARDMTSAILWVLSLNPSRFFYEAMGGERFAERDERLWGTVLHEIGYRWRQLV